MSFLIKEKDIFSDYYIAYPQKAKEYAKEIRKTDPILIGYKKLTARYYEICYWE